MIEKPNALKVTMLFPILDNNGEPFDEEDWIWWQDELDRLGDFTELGQTRGLWKGRNDKCRWIMAIVDEQKIGAIREFLAEARKRFRQEVMYLDYHPVYFELVK